MLSLISPINQLGYGVTGLNILKALSDITDVAYWPIGNSSSLKVTNQEDANIVQHAINNTAKFDPLAPCIRIWHQNDMAKFVGKGEHIGFPIFELNKFTDIEKHHLSSVDRLFVCSEWAKDIIKSEIHPIKKIPVDVIPLGVDSEVFNNTGQDRASTTTSFYNCGKWEVRKGHDMLYKAFLEAFGPEDDVALYMMCQNPFNSPEEEKTWRDKYKHPKIHIIDRVETQKEVYNIMKQMDCGVFPSRAEGWNLEALEMLACGKQLIITDYSAHTQFCNNKNSRLITIDENTIAYDGKWFHGHGEWANIGESQTKQLIGHMKEVHNLVQSKVDITNHEGIKTAKQFSWKNSANEILEVIDYVGQVKILEKSR